MNNILELNDFYSKEENQSNIFDDVEIIIDPELEDESTVDINNYLNKFILQCRICGNMFPSEEMLDNEHECPICDSKSSDGFIYKGKLKKKVDKEITPEEKTAIDNLIDETDADGMIPIEGDFDKYRKNDLTDNYDDIK